MRGGYSDIKKPFRIVAIVLTAVSVLCAILSVGSFGIVYSAISDISSSPDSGGMAVDMAGLYLGIELLTLFGVASITFSIQGIIASVLDVIKNQKAISFLFLAINSVEIIAIFSLLGWASGKVY